MRLDAQGKSKILQAEMQKSDARRAMAEEGAALRSRAISLVRQLAPEDATGELPAPADVRAFLADQAVDKRSKKIDELLTRPGHAALWTLKFCDVLKASVEDFVAFTWADGSQPSQAPRTRPDELFDKIQELSPKTETQRSRFKRIHLAPNLSRAGGSAVTATITR